MTARRMCELGTVRYADDCNIYVRSERAGQRVMESVKRFIAHKLKLKVNEAKSAVAKPQERKFLGFSFTAGRRPSADCAEGSGTVQATNPGDHATGRGRSMKKTMEELRRIYGAGVAISASAKPLKCRRLDSWIRRRLGAPCGSSGNHRAVARSW